jgi:very-short-patch-repair endonuclease
MLGAARESSAASGMASIEASIRERGGLAGTYELHGDGFTRGDIRRAVQHRLVIRVRQGWYALPGVRPELIQAARVGGRLTCLSGIRLHGAWQYPTGVLHVSTAANSCRLREPTDKARRLSASAPVQVHWRDHEPSGSRLLLAPLDCLSDLVHCQEPEIVMTAVDSALHNGIISIEQWQHLLSRAPAEARNAMADAEPRCESGTETLTRIRLTPFGLQICPQEQIPGVGRVDFLIGERLVIEVDGAEYHTDPERFEADRRRDAVLSRLGYRVLRFSYRQVMYRWQEVEDAVLAAVIRGDHH